MFEKILVANRGEIACRVMRTAQRLGYRCVAVYSDADRDALHVRQADEAIRIGPAPAAESYLRIDALIDAARRSGADAVHPGYGFLSERADFAAACTEAGLVFIGPPAEAIRLMGDKALAKQQMLAASVPCAPGFLDSRADDATLIAEAGKLGTPLLVKAVAGGGGRGMRLVHDLAELTPAIAGARREARSAFGDDALMLERLIDGARHVEVQVFADAHGHCIHLGERDCTAQRRRQKLVEESPSPIVDEVMRERLGHDAVTAALAVGYQGAGTVEFIVDAERRHYFLEMNTRLQVEHPVTECVTGLDLVEWQLRVAAGELLPLRQDQVRLFGHAIEARLVVEDPYDGWTPQTGRIVRWQPADALVRVDHGLVEGGTVTPHYDAMVAKLIAHGHDRDDARRRLVRALEDLPLFGPRTNARFLRDLLRHEDFTAARLTTTRLDEWAAAGAPLLQRPPPPEFAWRLAAALLGGAQGAAALAGTVAVQCDAQTRRLAVPATDVGRLELDAGWLHGEVDGVRRRLPCTLDGTGSARRVWLAIDAAVFSFTEASPFPRQDKAGDPRLVRAATAGVVAQLRVAAGDRVSAGQPLASIEAMKMEMWLDAGADGTVAAVHAAPGQTVAAGQTVIELEIDPP